MILISVALQARNHFSSRIAFVGSSLIFSNAVLNALPYHNLEYAQDLTAWTFREPGTCILRYKNIEIAHKRLRAKTIILAGDTLSYSVVIETWGGINRTWTAFMEDGLSISLERLNSTTFTKTLKQDESHRGKYRSTFVVPNSINPGTYNLRLSYSRNGCDPLLAFSRLLIHPTPLPLSHVQYTIYIFCCLLFFGNIWGLLKVNSRE